MVVDGLRLNILLLVVLLCSSACRSRGCVHDGAAVSPGQRVGCFWCGTWRRGHGLLTLRSGRLLTLRGRGVLHRHSCPVLVLLRLVRDMLLVLWLLHVVTPLEVVMALLLLVLRSHSCIRCHRRGLLRKRMLIQVVLRVRHRRVGRRRRMKAGRRPLLMLLRLHTLLCLILLHLLRLMVCWNLVRVSLILVLMRLMLHRRRGHHLLLPVCCLLLLSRRLWGVKASQRIRYRPSVLLWDLSPNAPGLSSHHRRHG